MFSSCIILNYLLVTVLLVCVEGKALKPPHVEDESYWRRLGQEELVRALDVSRKPNTRVARNIIVAIGDGMGISTVTAARIYDGQRKGHSGEENSLVFERFPHTALLKTYSLNGQVADSASTAFALLSGIKTSGYIVGLGNVAKRNVCSPALDEIETVLDWSLAAGKSVGIVTTDSVTGATPAAAYAHSSDRYWENDHLTAAPCHDIARQLIEDNPGINVILGGGTHHFLPYDGVSNARGRRDGRDLLEEWKTKKQKAGARYQFVATSAELDDVNPRNVDYLLGLFATKRFPLIHLRNDSHPSLSQMTTKALEILSKNEKGYFLLVEGANIDKAHHANKAHVALRETLEFNDAVKTIDNMTDQSDTFLAVTADHSHVFSIAGYPERGNPILSFNTANTGDKWTLDGKPGTTLGYRNGPGWIGRERPVITDTEINNVEFRFTGGRPLNSESHGGEDVAIHARGPWSHLLHAVHEQSYVAHVIAYAACIGETQRECEPTSSAYCSNSHKYLLVWLLILTMVVNCVF